MEKSENQFQILKSIWNKNDSGEWAICGMQGIDLAPKQEPESDGDYFPLGGGIQLMTNSPSGMGVDSLFSSFGTSDFLVKQSIVPVIAFIPKKKIVKCVGTGFFISCTGLLITAGHVVLDPFDEGYSRISQEGNTMKYDDGIEMGVLVPVSQAHGVRAFRVFLFEWCGIWGNWVSSPLIHEQDRFELLTDVAIAKVARMPDGQAHQPLNISLSTMKPGEEAYAIGCSEMEDMSLEISDEKFSLSNVKPELYASIGKVGSLFLQNHVRKEVPAPGPCFDFAARVPGKMSGGPIFGADGIVVRGVVSRSYTGEKHAYGALIGSVANLPLNEGSSLSELMAKGSEGIPILQGSDI